MRPGVQLEVGGRGASIVRLVHVNDSGRMGPKTSAGLPVGRPPGQWEWRYGSHKWGHASSVGSQDIGRMSALKGRELVRRIALHAGG